ncbi:PIN domain-containing protein [Paenibacillus sp. RRE4]|uniref:PIN domain-containing protein n=1 Tax=Paenibacillus sp. RRE4 TaxID=2962587 RepID=UPI0037CB0185
MKKKSNSNDAIIADTSVHEGCILITEDKDLYQRMKNNNYEVMHLQDFLSSM